MAGETFEGGGGEEIFFEHCAVPTLEKKKLIFHPLVRSFYSIVGLTRVHHMFISAAMNTFDKLKFKILQNLLYRTFRQKDHSSLRIDLAITSSTTKRRYKRGKKGRENWKRGKRRYRENQRSTIIGLSGTRFPLLAETWVVHLSWFTEPADFVTADRKIPDRRVATIQWSGKFLSNEQSSLRDYPLN